MTIRNLTKAFGDHVVFEDLTLTVAPGSFVCIVGPSGVGKTTLLRCISGLLPPSAGSVQLDETVVDSPRNEIGIVFQDYRGSLLPWMSTRENVAFPLQGKGVDRAERNARADKGLAAVGLAGVGDKYPWELSGGMQQRVAIARALAYDAHILLMDEPFGSVDAQTRFDLEDLVTGLRLRLGITVVVVTHDIDEAVYLSDQVIVLSGKPARVVDTVSVEFGRERDQIKTKSDPRFAELRTRILNEIRH